MPNWTIRRSGAFVRMFEAVGEGGVVDAEEAGEEAFADFGVFVEDLADGFHFLVGVH